MAEKRLSTVEEARRALPRFKGPPRPSRGSRALDNLLYETKAPRVFSVRLVIYTHAACCLWPRLWRPQQLNTLLPQQFHSSHGAAEAGRTRISRPAGGHPEMTFRRPASPFCRLKHERRLAASPCVPCCQTMRLAHRVPSPAHFGTQERLGREKVHSSEGPQPVKPILQTCRSSSPESMER